METQKINTAQKIMMAILILGYFSFNLVVNQGFNFSISWFGSLVIGILLLIGIFPPNED
jgi:hypothetical protein